MASCKEEIHVGDIGTTFLITLTDDCTNAVDLTGWTTLSVYFEKPDKTSITRTASISGGDPTLGLIEYATILDDLDQAGTWKVQAYVVLPTGSWKSNIDKFKVYPNIV